jgi:Ca-activated chloride channel family protein
MSSYLPMLTDAEPGDGWGAAGVGTVATERGNLPLQAIDVDATLTGLLARVALTQTFGNRFDQPLEATYIFPLPDRAAVTGFRMEVGERVVEGVLKERGQARAEYDSAVREGRRASIAEEERPGVFTMRVGNLLPGERVTVRLVMTGPLPWDDGEATFRFPLVVAPRYIPGAPLDGEPVGAGTEPDTDAVPDASRISPPVLLPGFPNPVDLSIKVRIDPAGLELGTVRSSLHAVVEEERDGVRVVRVEPGERADRDFVLRIRTGEGTVATAVAAADDAEGGQGTFALTLLPPAGTGAVDPRDVVFVLDRSGSMGGWKMVAARRAVARMVDSLTPRDRFLVLAFDNLIETPPELGAGLQAAGDHARFLAVDHLSRLEARGGTEMAAPLARALDILTQPTQPTPPIPPTPEPQPPIPGSPNREGSPISPAAAPVVHTPLGGPRDLVLVLVTDGQVGNEDQILRLLAPRLGRVRVYTVGVDTAVNEGFLKRLAGLGGGACELVESEDRLDEVMDRVHRCIGAPVLTDLELAPAGLDVDLASVAPRRLPALFAGSPLVVSGRFAGRSGGAVTVRARDAAGQPWSATVKATGGDGEALAATWARAHLRDLEDRYATDPAPDRELERRIVETSLRFGVLCRFTAFVAADVQVVNQGGVVHRVLQPVEAPAGWDMLRRVAAAMPMAAMHAGGLQAAPAADRAVAPRVQRAMLDRRLGGLPGRAGPGRPGRRSGGFPSHPLGGADLTPYRQRAGALATMLKRDRSHPDGVPTTPGRGPEAQPGTGPRIGPGIPLPEGRGAGGDLGIGGLRGAVGDLGRRLGLVRVGVETLVADLQSVDAVEEEVRPLRELAAELGRRLGPGVGVSMAGRPELERLRDLALAVLRAFATAQAPTAPTVPPAVTAEPPSAPTVRPVPTAAPPSAPTAPPGRHEPRDPGFWRR